MTRTHRTKKPIPSPSRSTRAARAPTATTMPAEAAQLDARLAELEVRIEELTHDEEALRIDAEEAAELSPVDTAERLQRLTELERRVRATDKEVWSLLDDVFELRQQVLAPFFPSAREAADVV